MFGRHDSHDKSLFARVGRRRVSVSIAAATLGAIGLFSLLNPANQPVHASVTVGSSVGIRAADFNMYGVNNDVGLVNQSVESLSGQLGHQTIRQAGIGWVRYWLSWQNIETTSTSYATNTMDWSRSDYDIDAAIAQGLNVYITIQSAPAWVHGGKNTYGWGNCDNAGAFNPSAPWCGQTGSGNDYAPFDPGGGNQSFYWKRFVSAAVARYGNRVKYWGFWNEANSQWMWPEYAAAPCNDRGAQLMMKVIRPGRDAALAANPSIKIVGPDTDSWDWLNWMLTLEHTGRNVPGCVVPPEHTFDVLSIHSYPWAAGGVPGDLNNYKSVLNNYDPREVWLTEVIGTNQIQVPLDEFAKRGWISKIFAYTMKGNNCATDLALLGPGFTPCNSYNLFKTFILANRPSMHFPA